MTSRSRPADVHLARLICASGHRRRQKPTSVSTPTPPPPPPPPARLTPPAPRGPDPRCTPDDQVPRLQTAADPADRRRWRRWAMGLTPSRTSSREHLAWATRRSATASSPTTTTPTAGPARCYVQADAEDHSADPRWLVEGSTAPGLAGSTSPTPSACAPGSFTRATASGSTPSGARSPARAWARISKR